MPRSGMELRFPVLRNLSRRPRHGLILGMPAWRGQFFSGRHPICLKIVKPGFARFETRDNRMAGSVKMLSRMLIGRAVATADVAAHRATPQMQPPISGSEAFDASGSARRNLRIDSILIVLHGHLLTGSDAVKGVTVHLTGSHLGHIDCKRRQQCQARLPRSGKETLSAANSVGTAPTLLFSSRVPPATFPDFPSPRPAER